MFASPPLLLPAATPEPYRPALKQRLRQLTSELNSLEGRCEAVEVRSRAIIRRMVALATRINSATAVDASDCDTSSVMTLATAAVRSALVRIHGVPQNELDYLVPSNNSDSGSGILCLAQWALLPSLKLGDGAALCSGQSSTGHAVFVKKHRTTTISLARLVGADADSRTSSAAPRTAMQTDAPNAPDLRESAVDAVRRGILGLKDGAQLLQTQLGGEQALLDQSKVLLQTSLENTSAQTRQVDTISGSGKRSGTMTSRVVVRVPGAALVWDHVLLPLWRMVRHALLIAVVLVATAVTVWMMLLVPRAYVRVQ